MDQIYSSFAGFLKSLLGGRGLIFKLVFLLPSYFEEAVDENFEVFDGNAGKAR